MPIDPNLKLKPSHPFKRGGIFFGMKPPEGWKPHSQPESSPPASSSNPDQEVKDWLEKGIYEAAGHQMGSQSIEDRLSELRDLFDKGLITQAEYEQRQAEILKEK